MYFLLTVAAIDFAIVAALSLALSGLAPASASPPDSRGDVEHFRVAQVSPQSAAKPGIGFKTEAEAKTACKSSPVVWLNTNSHVYHFVGTRDYGKTKAGEYMCETDAQRVGRPAKNEKH